MPGVRTGFAHVVAPLTEGKVTEFLLENGAHPFHFCPSPPVSLLFLSLTRPEKKRRPWGGSSLLENRSVIMGVGNVLSGRFWGESFPGEMLHREPPKFRMMSRAVRGQMHMLRPYGYRKGRRHGNSRRMIPLAPAVMGMRVFPHRRSAYAVQSREAQRTSSTLCPFTTYTPSGSATRTLPLLLWIRRPAMS